MIIFFKWRRKKQEINMNIRCVYILCKNWKHFVFVCFCETCFEESKQCGSDFLSFLIFKVSLRRAESTAHNGGKDFVEDRVRFFVGPYAR